jgi:hypothetical protein
MSMLKARRAAGAALRTGVGVLNVTIPGTLTVAGASTLTGAVTATDSVTTPTVATDTLGEKTANKGVSATASIRKGVLTTTASGDIVLTAASAPIQRIDCNGSHRNVDLPGLTGTTENGMPFEFQNISGTAVNIVVRKAGAGATVVTVNQTEKASVVVDAGDWVHTGVIGSALT